MAEVLARFLTRSGESTLWASINPILALGEPGYEVDTKRLRFGDGITAFTSLPYFLSTFTNPDLTAFDADNYMAVNNTPYTGNLNTLTGRKFQAVGTGASNGPTGAGVNDLIMHWDYSATSAIQEFYNNEDPYTVYRRSKVAGVWSEWATEVQLNGNQTVAGNKTFSGDTTIANLLSTILKGGYTTTAVNDGTISSGSYSPDPLAASPGNMRRIINNGSFTFAAPTRAGDYSLEVLITNGTTAGAITFTGFSKVGGDALNTTNANKFKVFISKNTGILSASVMAMQ